MPELDYNLASGCETSNQVCKCEPDEDCTCARRILTSYQ